MEKYVIYEGFMDGLREKIRRIERKCQKYGCEFHYAEIGEEYRNVINPEGFEETLRYVVVEAEGTAIVNGWEFVASVEHTESGNIYRKAMTGVEIPERYRCSDPFCEHCNTTRARKDTFIVRNNNGEFKQIGKTCLKDYTNGMSASVAASIASYRDAFEEAQTAPVTSCGNRKSYIPTMKILKYCTETIRHFGFAKADEFGTSTKERAYRYYMACEYGNAMNRKALENAKKEMEAVGFNADSKQAEEMATAAYNWITAMEDDGSDYLHNLKVATAEEYTTVRRLGLLASLYPAYDREMKKQAERKAQDEGKQTSEYVGSIGDKVTVDVKTIRCAGSWESCYGYSVTTTYIYEIIGTDGNVYIWKKSKGLDEASKISGTVKDHSEYRNIKQTVLTRCRVTA